MYNVQDYLERCVNSLLSQKLDDESYEILMINDGSTDNSFKKANQIAEKKFNIKLIHQENKGLGGARNTGIINASGKYILFLDADDKLCENSLGKLLNIAEKNNLEILEFAARGMDKNGDQVYSASNKSTKIMDGFEYFEKVRYMDSACNKLYKRDFLIKNNLLFKEKIYIEDFEFNTRTFSLAKKVMATDIIGAYFYQTPNSITRHNNKEKLAKMINDIKLVISNIHKQFLEAENIVPAENFYLEKLNYLTATLFYKMLQNECTYNEIKELRRKMIVEGIFYVEYPIYDKGKNIFRKILLKNIYLYPVFLYLFRFLKK